MDNKNKNKDLKNYISQLINTYKKQYNKQSYYIKKNRDKNFKY